MFTGNAGVGYFFLRVLHPLEVPSALAPRIQVPARRDNQDNQIIVVSIEDIRRRAIERLFKRTLAMLEHLMPKETADHFAYGMDQDETPEKERFIAFVERISKELQPDTGSRVVDVSALELRKLRIDEAIPSNAFLQIRNLVLSQQALTLVADENSLMKRTVRLNPDVQIWTTRWRWNLESATEWTRNLNLEPDVNKVLLIPSPLGTIENELSTLTCMVLDAFQVDSKVEKAIESLADTLGAVADSKDAIARRLFEQVEEVVASGILVLAEPP